MTLSIRYFDDVGNTSPQMRLMIISTKPMASILRRGCIISRMSGHNSRKRSEARFWGTFCGVTAVYTIVWDALSVPRDADILMPTLYSGTSGFAYPSWKPDFYAERLPAKKFLSYYAT